MKGNVNGTPFRASTRGRRHAAGRAASRVDRAAGSFASTWSVTSRCIRRCAIRLTSPGIRRFVEPW